MDAAVDRAVRRDELRRAAAETAAIDSAVGHRVGFWNPLIYKFAQLGPGTSSNVGTGLGTSNFAKLALGFGVTGLGN